MADFERTIEALWKQLALGSPKLGETKSIDLVIDGMTVTLSEAADQRGLLLTGRAGRIATDRVAAERQVRRILGIAAGLLATNAAVIAPDPDAPDPKPVLIRCRHPYQGNRIDRLVAAIQDVLQGIEMVRPELETASAGRPAPRPANEAFSVAETMIFRP